MYDKITKHIDAPARAMMALIFILSGVGKIGAIEPTKLYMEAFGLPSVLLAPTILFEIGAGLLMLIGFQTRLLALALAGFSLLTAIVFHRDFGDQIQQIMFLKNVAIAGGFLVLAQTGAPQMSLDKFLQKGRS